MLLGARQFFERRGKSAPTARDYVQNGLIAMWDGIENAGWGVHDPNATTWVDLSGNGHDASFSMGHQGGGLNPDGRWTHNAYQFPNGSVSTASFIANLGSNLSLQFCFSDRVSASKYYGFYDTWDDAVAFYHIPPITWSQVVYGTRNNIFNASADYLPQAGTITHFFGPNGSGLQINLDAARGDAVSIGSSSSKTWCIGGPYGTNYFTGKMHCVRIYNRVLTADEFAANYAIDKARFNLP